MAIKTTQLTFSEKELKAIVIDWCSRHQLINATESNIEFCQGDGKGGRVIEVRITQRADHAVTSEK